MSNANKSGTRFLPILGMVGILAATGAGAYYYFQEKLPSPDNLPLKAAQIVPESAIASSFIATDAQNWNQLTQYGTPEARQAIQDSLEKWQEEIFSNQKLTFEKDIQPWIKGLTLAFVPSKSTGTTSDPYEMLVIVGVKNQSKAREFMEKSGEESGITPDKQDYKGITIINVPDANGDRLSWAMVGEQLVLAENSQIITQAIDTFKGQPSYGEKAGVKKLFSRPLTIDNLLVTIYIPDYAKMVEQTIISGDQEIPTTTLKQLNQVKSVVVGMGTESQGLHLQAIAQLNPNEVKSVPKAVKGEILRKFPSNTLAFINGQGIKNGWLNLVEQSQQEPQLQGFVSQIRQGFKSANLDVDQDIFGWMDGEFALGILSFDRGGIANLGLGGMMIVETSDRPTAEQTVEKLNQIAQFTPFIQFNERRVGGTEIGEWKIPQQDTILSYGWINNQSLMLTSGISWEGVQEAQKRLSLPQSPNFKATQTALPSNNLGYGYLDIEKTTMFLNALPISTITPGAKTIINSVQGLGMTVTQPDQLTSQLDVVLSLISDN